MSDDNNTLFVPTTHSFGSVKGHVTSIPQGIKHDQDKPDVSLVSPYAIEAIARVMTFGAKKYNRDNWRGGIKFNRLLAAALRHIVSYEKGEDKDPESGESHISHAL